MLSISDDVIGPEGMTRVIVGSRDLLVRSGTRFLLDQHPAISVIAEGSTVDQTHELAANLRPDAVVLSVSTGNSAYHEALLRLAAFTRVVLIIACSTSDYERYANVPGASVVLPRDGLSPSQLHSAVLGKPASALSVRRSAVLGPHMSSASAVRTPRGERTLRELLSPREAEVMDLIACGHRNSDIAHLLYVSEKTVKNHINHVFAKLQVDTRSRAILAWLGHDSTRLHTAS